MRLASLLLGFASLLVPVHASATAQIPDVLVLDGETIDLNTLPLAPLIAEGRVVMPNDVVASSANWRGYRGHWVIEDDSLWLTAVKLERWEQLSRDVMRIIDEDILPSLFPGQTRVEADWYTGALVIPRGEVVDYVHMGFASTHERYTLLGIRAGRVVERRELDARAYAALRRERFAAWQATDEYRRLLADVIRDGDEARAEDFLYDFSVERYMSIPAD